ncbi:hypothetical protein EIP91_004172 [Steccherinum ochraceum]|uniref:Uncharacterized protein n=1 Tax=Steccherinum ochraceum TaxID=92696 RepID=A0A4R0RNM8_9APHY|nr:hypothetical protein EIP91_004172 [Steccherinum ochraceum]
MARQLRKRTSRPNYALLADADEQEAGPSNTSQRDEADEEEAIASGSDFAPDQEDNALPEDEEEEDVQDDPEDGDASAGLPSEDSMQVESIIARKPAKKKFKGPAKAQSAIIIPSFHHRHRAVPIFTWDGKVERLKEKPRLLRPPELVPTNSWTFSGAANDRLSKAAGFNVGPGPLWELMEDRAWFKECFEHYEDEGEAYRRPRVHEDVQIPDGWETLSEKDAAAYIPSISDIDRSTPPVSCGFGKIKDQTRVSLKTFDSVKISTYITGSQSHVFNAGASVWGLDWCPIHPDDRQGESLLARSFKQYLAIAPLPSRKHPVMVGAKIPRPAPACIQIWSLSPTESGEDVDGDAGEMCCELVVCTDGGAARELKWCPLPSNDHSSSNGAAVKKLGLVAGTFEDGSVSVYAIPDPADLQPKAGGGASGPIFIRMSKPLLRLELEDTSAWCLDWANSEILAVGCTNGHIAVYDVAAALQDTTGTNHRVLPTHYFAVHQSAIQAITWVRVPTKSATGENTADNPTVIATGGFDGQECLSDIRESTSVLINRTRDIVNSMDYSAYYGGPITIDQENTVKAYSLAPAMLGRGHKFLEPNGPVWNIHSSDYHPQLAVGVSDGSCLTTNTMRSTRRGSAVAFFSHKIFQLDYSQKTEEYRMLEHFLPEVCCPTLSTEPFRVLRFFSLLQEVKDRPSATKANQAMPIGTGAWSPEVGVQRVVWNDGNGLAAAPLLASATGSGLCRVDWLMGRWYKDRIPYSNVETIRQEVEGEVGMDEDSD